jgi:hypothetical protein
MRAYIGLGSGVAAAVVLAVACGGQTITHEGSVGSGGAGIAGTGGNGLAGAPGGGRLDAGLGGAGGVAGGGTAGGMPATGGSAGGAAGGAGGSPILVDASPPPVWPDAQPNSACSIASNVPLPVRWVDDFEGLSNYMSDLAWSELDDGAEVITSGQGTPIPTLLDAVGSYDGKSKYGMHFQGYMPAPGTETTYGAGFNLTTDYVWGAPGTRLSVDWSAYKGVVFWARLAAPSGVKGNVTFTIPDIDTDPGGGRCSDNAVAGGGVSTCYANFAKDLRITRVCWMPFDIPFAKLTQPWGVPAPNGFDAAHVYGVGLGVSANAFSSTTWKVDYAKSNWPIDFYIDDMYLY